MTTAKKSRSDHASQTSKQPTQSAPMIVERVNQIPIVNLALAAGYSQYDKLKASNVTVGDVMSQAERWAAYMWNQVQPVVDKLHDPIEKVDKLACKTLDYVEASVPAIKKSPQEIISDSKTKYSQVVEQSTIVRILRSLTEILYGSALAAKDVIIGAAGCQSKDDNEQKNQQHQQHQHQQPQQHSSHEHAEGSHH